MHLRRSEYVFWTLAILIAPWAAYGGSVALVGRPRGDGPMRLAFAGFAVALWFAIGDTLPWRLAWASRAPVIAFRFWLNRRWRWTYSIAPRPARYGAYSIWVSKALGPDERRAVARFADALAVVATVAPSRAARLERLGVQFAVTPMHAYAGYMPSANVLALDPAALSEAVEVIAGIIVHEGNHALVASRNLMHPLLQERTERAARRDQLLFGRRLLLAGKVEEAYRVRALVIGAIQADDSVRAHWQRVKAAFARHQESIERNDA